MPDPVTHLLFSWIMAALLVQKPSDKLLVIISGIFMDIDVFFGHHGPMHTPFFAFIVFLILLIPKRFEFRLLFACLFAMSFHIFLDFFATMYPVMLLYPISHDLFNFGTAMPYVTLIILKFILLFSSLILTYYLWHKGNTPMEVIEWSKERFGNEAAYLSILLFLSLIIYRSYGYLVRLLEILFL